MGKYLIKSDLRLMEAASKAQLERLVLTGLVARDALVRTLPDGPWTRAEKHPDTADHFRAGEVERTLIAVSPAPRDEPEEPEIFWVRTGVSTVEARGLDVLKRLYELGVVRADHGVGTSPRGPFTPLADHPALSALASPSPSTDSQPVGEGDDDDDVFTSASGAVGHSLTQRPGAEASVVIALSDAEIEYFQEEVSQKRALGSIQRDASSNREVSNIIVLSGAEIEFLADSAEHHEDHDDAVALDDSDIQIIVDEPMLVEESVDDDDIQELSSLEEIVEEIVDDEDVVPVAELRGRRGPTRRGREVSEVIQLSVDDIEELEHIEDGVADLTPDASWDQFSRAMNLAAERLTTGTEGHRQELTWDLFRSMMEVPDRNGPSESSWNRFRARIDGRTGGQGRTPLPVETTWDRFRELMTAPDETNDTTWNRFVRNIHTGRTGHPGHRRGRDAATAARQAGSQPIAGESRIKSDVVRIVENAGPKVRVEGSLDKHRRVRIERVRSARKPRDGADRREDGGDS